MKRRRIFYNCSGGHIRHTRKPSVYLCESCGHAGIALHLKGKETIAECATECQCGRIGTKAVWMEAKWNPDKLDITCTAEFINKSMRLVDKTCT